MHVSPPSPKGLRWFLKPIFWRQRRRFGVHLLPALVWARVPALYAALSGFYAAIERRSSPLPPVLRALVQTRVSQVNHCDFCIDLNAAMAAQRSGNVDKVLAVETWRAQAELFSELEQAALDYAETITRTDGRVDAAMIARLRRHLDEEGLIELTALVAFQNLSSKFNAALELPSQGLCRLPGDRPQDPT